MAMNAVHTAAFDNIKNWKGRREIAGKVNSNKKC
jgi:hypothetical protein